MARGPPHRSWSTGPSSPVIILAALSLLCYATAASAQRVTQATGFSTAIAARREDSRLFYQIVYKASSGVTLTWTGDTATCNPGTTNDDFTVSGQRRLNYFRALAGVPPTVAFLPQLTAMAQRAALIYLANPTLVQKGKRLDATWTCFSADGGTAASGGNLIRGGSGAFAIDYWINDTGIANLGHRRVLLFPSIRNAGQGNVGARTRFESTASSLYLDRKSDLSTRPATRDEYVAWPPPGFIPYSLMPPDWSFSHPSVLFNKSSSVTLTRGTISVPLLIFVPNEVFGDPNIIVFTPLVTSTLPISGPDTTYTVKVSKGFIQSGGKYVTKDFTYTVTGFDPSIKDPVASVLPRVSGKTSVKAKTVATFSFTRLSILSVDSYDFRGLLTTPVAWTDSASQGTANFAVNISAGYTATTTDVFNTGPAAFHLVHPLNTLQTLTLLPVFYVPSAAASVTFFSRLGAATVSQIAQVQVSADEGATWQTVWSQQGSGNPGETAFVARSVPLSGFVGSIIRIRFAYAFDKTFGFAYFNQVQAGVGWYIDDVSLPGVSTATYATSGVAAKTATSFKAKFPFKGLNVLQVRGAAFGNYALEWGPTFALKVT